MPVHLTIDDQRLSALRGLTLFDCANRVGVRVPSSCPRMGLCRECLIEVAEGMTHLSPRSPEEQHLDGGFRLACRAHIASDDGTVRCHTMRRGKMVIADGGASLDHVLVDAPLDPAIRRDGKTILIDGRSINQSRGPLLGVAVDVGTTTVVARLVDLESGRVVQSQAFENPQRFGGSDVLARIHYDTVHTDRLLQRTLLGYLGHVIAEFDCREQDIYEMVVVGNSTMRDLFFGLNVYSIGQKPFQSLSEKVWRDGKRDTTVLSTAATMLGLSMHDRARVYGLPLVRGHVGADAAACLLAIDLPREDRLVALMDIGTNTELIVGNRRRVFAASCPAGPAFEGGAIACGMPALDGAIESVTLGDNGDVTLTVIGDGPPQGICGSGLVDSIGELLRTGRMNRLGRMTGGRTTGGRMTAGCVAEGSTADGGKRLILDHDKNIYLGEADISHLAQAKGANVAGMEIVLRQYGANFDDLDQLYLAGGFAHHLNIQAAKRMGLIPNIPDEKIVQIGNAAIEGATIALRSVSRRRELDRFVQEITHVELEEDEHFFDQFVDGCQFVPFPQYELKKIIP